MTTSYKLSSFFPCQKLSLKRENTGLHLIKHKLFLLTGTKQCGLNKIIIFDKVCCNVCGALQHVHGLKIQSGKGLSSIKSYWLLYSAITLYMLLILCSKKSPFVLVQNSGSIVCCVQNAIYNPFSLLCVCNIMINFIPGKVFTSVFSQSNYKRQTVFL